MYPSALLLRVILCTGKYSSKKIVKPYEYQSKVKIFKVSFGSKRSMYSIFFFRVIRRGNMRYVC